MSPFSNTHGWNYSHETSAKSRFNHAFDTEKRYQSNLDELDERNALNRAADWMDSRPFSPLPLRTASNVPFPIEVFSAEVQRHLRTISATFGVPLELVGSMFLGALAIACRGKFRVMRNNSHHELLTLFLLMTLPSGSGKSGVHETFMVPIIAREKAEREAFLATTDERENMQRIYVLKLRAKERELAELTGDRTEDIRAAAEMLDDFKRMMPPAPSQPPRCLFSRLTPAGIELAACRQGGILGISSGELGSFKQLPENRDEIFLMGYEGGSFSYAKATGIDLRAERVRMAIVLFSQDAISLKLLGKKALQEDGMLARFLVVTAPDGLHVNDAPSDALPAATQDLITQVVEKVMDIPQVEGDIYHDLTIAPHASMRAWTELHMHAGQQRVSAELSPVLRGFYGKLAGTALRLAGFLHLIEADDPVGTPISESAIERGIKLAKFFEAQALASLDPRRANALANAHSIVDAAKKLRKESLDFREIYRTASGKPSREEVLDAVALLEEHNIVAWRKVGKSDRIVFHREYFLEREVVSRIALGGYTATPPASDSWQNATVDECPSVPLIDYENY